MDFDNSSIVSAYRAHSPTSAELAEAAGQLFPSGLTHDSRYLRPYGIYVEKAEGSRKWDVDGNEYVDYFGGHGALLLGHGHPEVIAAAHSALDAGSHFGAGHQHELRWAQVVQRLIPSAERVRFTSSGTEATHLALRLARAHTGRSKVLRLKGHFHGWNDHMTSGYSSHFDGSPTPGVLPGIAEGIKLIDPSDLDTAAEILQVDNDIAAIILEPTGASFGMVPLQADYLTGLRELTLRHEVLLIFDEVVTGFRVSRGGAQAHYGISPDLTTLAKILGGGLPGAAVAGREDLLEALDFGVSLANKREKIQHQGTFNANPVSAAAGHTALSIIEVTDACERANTYAERLRNRLNEVLATEDVSWAAYGTFSGFHLFTNPKNRHLDPLAFVPGEIDWQELKSNSATATDRFRLAMMVNGVDIAGWPGGVISAVHDDSDLEHTVAAFKESLKMLRADGLLG